VIFVRETLFTSIDLISWFSSFFSHVLQIQFGFVFWSGFFTGMQRTLEMENRLNSSSFNAPIYPNAIPLRPAGLPLNGKNLLSLKF